MEPSGPPSLWKLQHLLCFLSHIFKEFSCFFEEKALGPMPPHRKSILGFVRSFSSMSTLLVITSLKLKEAASDLQSPLVPGISLESMAPNDVDTLCQASLRDLFQIWAYTKPIFGNLQKGITIWSRDKSKYPGRGILDSPLDADFETIAEILSYVQCLLCELLYKLKPLLGSRFMTDIHVLMKLGREIHLREKIKPQLDLIFYENSKPVGTVFPFQSLYDIEAVGNVVSQEKRIIWHEYSERVPFRYSYQRTMETRRHTIIFTQKPTASKFELWSRNLLHPVRIRQMFSLAKASPPSRLMDEEIWIGQERTSKYDRFFEATTLRDVISVSIAQKRVKTLLVSLHPTCMLLFRQRGHSLILQHEISRADILLVTHDFRGAMGQEVDVCWKSSSTEPISIAYLKLIFDDATKSKVWASCLAPRDVPYELIAEPSKKDSVPPVPQLLNSNPRSHGTSIADSQEPAWKISPEDKIMNQAQRLLSKINNQDLDLLDYRIVCLRGIEVVLIQDRHTAVRYAATDILVDEMPRFLQAKRSSSEDVEKTLGSSSNDHPVESSMKGFHLGEYLETCGGTWTLSEEPSHKSCYIEVPTELTTPPSPIPVHNFRIALDSLILEFMRSYSPIWLAKLPQRGYRHFYNRKLMVYSREPLEELEEWVRESFTKTEGILLDNIRQGYFG